MSKNVKINGATYENVPKVSIPLAKGEGNADFYDTSSDTAGAGDILVGKTSHNAGGLVTWLPAPCQIMVQSPDLLAPRMESTSFRRAITTALVQSSSMQPSRPS